MDPARDPRARPGAALTRGRVNSAGAHERGSRRDASHPGRRRSARRWPLRTRLQRWLNPPRTLRPTRAGWCFFAITLGVGFASLNTGNNLLYLVLSLMLAFLVLSGLLSEAALRGIAVERILPREIFAGAANPVTLRICNHQRNIAAFAVVVEDRFRDPSADPKQAAAKPAGRGFVLRIGPMQRELRRYALRPEQRGALEFLGYRVSTRFPFGLFVKAMLIDSPTSALVYPEIEPLAAQSRAGRAREEGCLQADPRSGLGVQIAGVRDYVQGDSTRRIHWRRSIRRGQLVVGESEREEESEVEVRLRIAATDDFEARVRWAASEIVCHLDAGVPVSLRTDADYLPPGTGRPQRDALRGRYR